MKKERKYLLSVLSVLLVIVITSCYGQTNIEIPESNLNLTPSTDQPNEVINKNEEDPYRLEIKLEQIDDNPIIEISIDLDSGCYITSPFAKGMKGRFIVSLDDNQHLILSDEIIVTPKSIEKDVWWNDNPVKLIEVNTNFQQKIKLLSKDDFEVSGIIQFVIEPKCTMEKKEFVISNRKGKMEIKLK